jgi:hypothetical protein
MLSASLFFEKYGTRHDDGDVELNATRASPAQLPGVRA